MHFQTFNLSFFLSEMFERLTSLDLNGIISLKHLIRDI